MNKNGEFEESEVFFYAKDHLNSVHSITDRTGKPLQRYSYSAYGRTKVEKTNPNDLKFIKSPYAFTSREWEEETGDYYYRARYYDGKVGRFLSEDPIGFSSRDMNHYRYVKNKPLNFNDPKGYSHQLPYEKPGIPDYVNSGPGGDSPPAEGAEFELFMFGLDKFCEANPSICEDNPPADEGPGGDGPGGAGGGGDKCRPKR